MSLEERLQSWKNKQERISQLARFVDDNDNNDKTQTQHNLNLHLNLNDVDDPTTYHIPTNSIDSINNDSFLSTIKYVGGLDISFIEGSNGNQGIVTLVVMKFPSLEIVGSKSRHVTLDSPYVPSFLSIRESAPVVSLLNDTVGLELNDVSIIDSILGTDQVTKNDGDNQNFLEKDENDIKLPKPQVIFVDGNGRLHEREAGLATAIGVLSGYRTIGIGKDYHPLHSPKLLNSQDHFRLYQKSFKNICKQKLHKFGDFIGIYGRVEDSYVGAALYSSPDKSAKNPIYVSSGNRLSLETCIQLTLLCCKTGRIPDPVRYADSIGRNHAKNFLI